MYRASLPFPPHCNLVVPMEPCCPYGPRGNQVTGGWGGWGHIDKFRSFPNKRQFQLLLDEEPLLHAPPAKRAMQEFGITTLPDWPASSPELNPAEHVPGVP